MNKYVLILVILISSSFLACEKDAGEGGTSTIVGNVFVYRYDVNQTSIVDTVVGAREDVYIIYGPYGGTYDDDFEASYDGSYRFSNLRKGKYTLFAYSRDTTGLHQSFFPNGQNSLRIPVKVTIEITDNKSEVRAPDIIIFDER
jgi:hypothetical protein